MKSLILNLLFASLVASEATVYLIRHGEKPNSGNGLSKEGKERANCLVNVFNTSSPYEIGHIMAETPHSGKEISFRINTSSICTDGQRETDGSQQRPYDTVLPLAESLNLTVDTSCDRDDQECVAGVVSNYTGPGNILIW